VPSTETSMKLYWGVFGESYGSEWLAADRIAGPDAGGSRSVHAPPVLNPSIISGGSQPASESRFGSLSMAVAAEPEWEAEATCGRANVESVSCWPLDEGGERSGRVSPAPSLDLEDLSSALDWRYWQGGPMCAWEGLESWDGW
jgi:hypothetical protein